MKTLYIDVYFLINFTVDLLSLYFGALTAKIKSSAKRLIIASVISALFACLIVLTNLKKVLFIFALVLNAVFVTEIFCGKISAVRKIKLFIAFLIFETLIGGFVTFVYGLLDRHFYPLFESGAVGAENKSLILLAILILMIYGILRLTVIVFSTSSAEKNAKLKIVINKKEFLTDALVDSGNLLCDPMDSSPVIVVKRDVISTLLGSYKITENENLKPKIRLIPTKSIIGEKILIGIRCDHVFINERKFQNTVIAVDEEDGTFGGYSALIPSYFVE